MPTTTKKKPTAPKPVAAAPEPVAEREFWVLNVDPVWKDFTGPEYFYDGQIDVKNGVARVPVNRTDWVKRLLFSNYTFASKQDEADFDRIA